MAIPETGADDLTQITGIGTKIASRLNEAGIETYADLASRSAGEIRKLLPDISALPGTRVDGWRREAGRRATAKPVPASLEASGNNQHYESFLVRVLLNVDGSVRRTTMRHVGTGSEHHWAGLGGEALADFIRASAHCAPDGPGAQPSVGPAPSEAAGEPAAPFAAVALLSAERTMLRAAQPFTITLTVDVGQPPRAGRLGYRAVIVARPLGSGPKRTVAQADGLMPATASAVSIDAAGLPPGVYRLDGAVSLSEPGSERPLGLAAIAEGLLVQVLPA